MPAGPTAPGALLDGSYPEIAGCAVPGAPQGFGVGGIGLPQANLAVARRQRDALLPHTFQNNAFAATSAAATRGAGKRKKKITSTPETANTAFSTPGIGSNRSAGSSKYIILIMRR